MLAARRHVDLFLNGFQLLGLTKFLYVKMPPSRSVIVDEDYLSLCWVMDGVAQFNAVWNFETCYYLNMS